MRITVLLALTVGCADMAPLQQASPERLVGSDGVLPPMELAHALGADVNGDGFDDLLTWSPLFGAERVLHVRPGSPRGPAVQGFQAGPAYDRLDGFGLIRACDLDADGDDDLLRLADGVVEVLEGGPAGLAPAASYPLVSEGSPIRAGYHAACDDLDADGFPDLVWTAEEACTPAGCGPGVAVVHGGPGGLEGDPRIALAPTSGGDGKLLLTGDLTSDGLPEVAVSKGGRIELYNFGPRGAEAQTEVVAASVGLRAESVGDLDGDGERDIAIFCVTSVGGWHLTGASALLRDPCDSPPLTLPNAAGSSATAEVVVAGDLDGDGLDDVVMEDPIYEAIWALRGMRGGPAKVDLGAANLLTLAPGVRMGRLQHVLPVGDLWGMNRRGLLLQEFPALGPTPLHFVVDLRDADGDGVQSSLDCRPGQAGGRGRLAWVDDDGDGRGSPWRAVRVCGRLRPGLSLSADDCDDADPTVFPGAPEAALDAIDSDCDGVDTCYVDEDGDGFRGATVALSPLASCFPAAATADCDDADPTRQPGVEQPGDGVDAGCDGAGLCFADSDGDGLGGAALIAGPEPCVGPGLAARADDCDDLDAAAGQGPDLPGDDVDQDCDGRLICLQDGDNDGYWVPSDPVQRTSCAGFDPSAVAALGEDCDEGTSGRGRERLWYQDLDGDGIGTRRRDEHTGDPIEPWTVRACLRPAGYVDQAEDCDDLDASVHPGAAEGVDGFADRDCDGRVTSPFDHDGDGFGGRLVADLPYNGIWVQSPTWLRADDCDDHDPYVQPERFWGLSAGVTGCLGYPQPELTVTAGATWLIEATGLPPQATVSLYQSTDGPGLGPCPAVLAGGCVPLLDPVRVAVGSTDTTGAWVTSYQPAVSPGDEVHLLAIVAGPPAELTQTVLTIAP